jgi:hypothetical protein
MLTKSKYPRTVPPNASAMPMEPMRMYFQEASTEAFVTWSGMSRAEVIVVASTAIHMKPTLLEVTANSMVNVNRLPKIRNRRASAAS